MANEHSQIVPSMQPTATVADFKFWCQKVLPLVYDDSLSYYEVLNKMVVYLNQVIDNINADIENVEELEDDFLLLQEYVNNFFDDIDQLASYTERAEAAETSAISYAANAAESASNSATSASNAASSASSSATSALSAMDAKDAAVAAKTAAETALATAQTAATNAASSATAAGNSATAASGSATNAATSATAAQQSFTLADAARTAAQSAASTAEGVLESIPEDYTELSYEVTDLNTAITQYLYGDEKTFSVEANKNNTFKFPFLKGESYSFINNSGGSCNVLLLKSDSTTKTISANLSNGTSIGFVPDAEDYIAVRSWIPSGATGTVKIESYYSILGSKNDMQAEIDEKMNKIDFADGDVLFSEKQYEINATLNNDGNSTYIWKHATYKEPINQYEMIGIKCENVTGNIFASPFYVYLYDANDTRLSSTAYALNSVKDWLIINPPANAAYFTVDLYPSQTGGLVDTSAVFTNILVCKSKNGKSIIKDDSAPLPYLPYPYYFKNSYLQNKVETILQKMEAGSGNYDAFIFCTDQHWRGNAKQSPKLINYITERLCIPRMFMGGDYEDGVCFSAYMAFRQAYNGEIYNIMGNHEYMDGQISDTGGWSRRVNTDATFFACLNGCMENAVFGDVGRNYYYVDNTVQKMRYIVLSIFTDESEVDFSSAQQTWFANTALDLPSGYTAIVFAHHVASVNKQTGALTFQTYDQTICDIVDAYNGNGEIACLIGGHTHFDGLGATNGGIPIFVTSCDKNEPYSGGGEEYLESRVTGTIDEQVFDVFIVNKTAKKVTAVRIGCPAYNPTGDPLQIREATY